MKLMNWKSDQMKSDEIGLELERNYSFSNGNSLNNLQIEEEIDEHCEWNATRMNLG